MRADSATGRSTMTDERTFHELYRETLPVVYGFLLRRCGSRALAEDLTSETFLAAASAARSDVAITVPWLLSVARHKLIDHWRRRERERRRFQLVWDREADDQRRSEQIDREAVLLAMRSLQPGQQAALALRYLDDLPVSEVATVLGRTVHATESLLVRARAAFALGYQKAVDDDV